MLGRDGDAMDKRTATLILVVLLALTSAIGLAPSARAGKGNGRPTTTTTTTTATTETRIATQLRILPSPGVGLLPLSNPTMGPRVLQAQLTTLDGLPVGGRSVGLWAENSYGGCQGTTTPAGTVSCMTSPSNPWTSVHGSFNGDDTYAPSSV